MGLGFCDGEDVQLALDGGWFWLSLVQRRAWEGSFNGDEWQPYSGEETVVYSNMCVHI